MSSENNKTFLGLMYIIDELLKTGILQYDPENHDNMLVYRSAGENSTEGWYSQNILSAVSELFQDKEQVDYVLSVATDNGIDVENFFKDANRLLSS